jgi:hypothetical protein
MYYGSTNQWPGPPQPVPAFVPGSVLLKVTARNLGLSNNGLPEDVVVSHFGMLPGARIPGVNGSTVKGAVNSGTSKGAVNSGKSKGAVNSGTSNGMGSSKWGVAVDDARASADTKASAGMADDNLEGRHSFFAVYNGLAPDVPDEAHGAGPALGEMEVALSLTEAVLSLHEWATELGGGWVCMALAPAETVDGPRVVRVAMGGGSARFFHALLNASI